MIQAATLSLLLSSALSLVAMPAWAQTSGSKTDTRVKVETGSSSEDTTISVRKGALPDRKFEITEGQDELTGEPAALQKEARANWLKACNDWKKELKELNSANIILSMNCGSPNCETTAMQTQCKSNSKHKIRVQVN